MDTFDVHITRILNHSLTVDSIIVLMAYPPTELPFPYVPDCVNIFSTDGEILPFLFCANDKWRSDPVASDVKARVDVRVKNDQFCYISQNHRLGSLFRLFKDHNSCCCAV